MDRPLFFLYLCAGLVDLLEGPPVAAMDVDVDADVNAVLVLVVRMEPGGSSAWNDCSRYLAMRCLVCLWKKTGGLNWRILNDMTFLVSVPVLSEKR